MSLADTIVIFGLALILFGPKKLPEIGRQIGKLLAEFRRASNEFKFQLDEELRTHEQAEQKAKSEAASRLTIQPPTTGFPVGPSNLNEPAVPAELPASIESPAVSHGSVPTLESASLPSPAHEPELAPPPPNRSTHNADISREIIESNRG